tara:strand:- start:821 stop:1312 length:492 start_codon:yes stop_codon:yes gene_type:complete
MLGQTKQAPDEFAVMSRAPLSLPPNFNLRVPKPGAERPQDASRKDAARKILLQAGSKFKRMNVGDIKKTLGENKIRDLLGADVANPKIREILNEETVNVEFEDQLFIDKLLSWKTSSEKESLVDPAAEAKRIKANEKTGKRINEGEVPIIKRGKMGLINRLFQ